jgi:hypothetical protein
MKVFLDKFIKRCPKSGNIKGINYPTGIYRIFFPLIGLAALIWILIRVIPKPSRATYPCVQAAAPLASGLIIYITSIILTFTLYISTKKKYFLSPYFLLIGLAFLGVSDNNIDRLNSGDPDSPLPTISHVANVATGDAKGIFPGRVVWVYDPAATNENCNPTAVGKAWWMPENNNQFVIDEMVSKAIKSLTGKQIDKDAWDAIFKYHNNTRGKGSVVYNKGEKIFIKINNVSGWGGNFSTKDLSVVANGSYGISETSPHVVLSILRQLVNTVGVSQSDIYVGDPMRNTYKHCFDMWHAEFPDVHYLSYDDYSKLGRERVTASKTAKIFYSDKGKILKENVWDVNRPGGNPITDDNLYTIFEEAEYLLNIPVLKGHKRAGATMFAKNHFGSHTRANAAHLHNGLIDPIEIQNSTSRREYGLYRVQVDIMGSKYLGEKNLFYLMDALWPADQEISFPKKFSMKPFNNDWMSSIFASLDPVAIESVGYDFLRTEFTAERKIQDGAGTYAQKPATDDYLHQASDPALWAEGIKYDPNNTGVYLTSLGTHEHWNNAVEMQYSRNLGLNTGIELIKHLNLTNIERENELPTKFELAQNYPNPFNPVTTIEYTLPRNQFVSIRIYDAAGSEVAVLENSHKPSGIYRVQFNAKGLSSGVYYYKIITENYSNTKKMILLK